MNTKTVVVPKQIFDSDAQFRNLYAIIVWRMVVIVSIRWKAYNDDGNGKEQ